jgi:DNA-binding NtrC family response regulator
MPRLDGVAMLKQMQKAGRKEKVIIMTAKPADQRLWFADPSRVVKQLLKPFKIDNFLEVVIAATSNADSMAHIENPKIG